MAELLHQQQIPGFTFSFKLHPPHAVLPWHRHAGACLCLLLKGRQCERDDGREESCGVLDLVFKPPEMRHYNRIGGFGAALLTVEVAPNRWLALQKQGLRLEAPLRSRSVLAAGIAARIRRELGAPDALTPLALEALALELLTEAARLAERQEPSGGPSWLLEVRERIESEFSERLTHLRLSETAGVHPVHLAQRFRAHFGSSIGSYLRRVRVEQAARRLVETSLPLAAVALDSGFYDQSHFHRIFKRATGFTPAAYRRLFHRP